MKTSAPVFVFCHPSLLRWDELEQQEAGIVVAEVIVPVLLALVLVHLVLRLLQPQFLSSSKSSSLG